MPPDWQQELVIRGDVLDDAISAALALVADDGRVADARRGPLEQEVAKAERARARLERLRDCLSG